MKNKGFGFFPPKNQVIYHKSPLKLQVLGSRGGKSTRESSTEKISVSQVSTLKPLALTQPLVREPQQKITEQLATIAPTWSQLIP